MGRRCIKPRARMTPDPICIQRQHWPLQRGETSSYMFNPKEEDGSLFIGNVELETVLESVPWLMVAV